MKLVLSKECFDEGTRSALANPVLQTALTRHGTNWPQLRERALAELPEYEALRHHAATVKKHTLENLDFYLEAFEERVLAAGGQVHWCVTAQDAIDRIIEICQKAGAKTVTKGKSMVGEEIHLNEKLAAAGIVPIETDLGEYVLQLADQPPSHVVAPAMHMSMAEVRSLFQEHHAGLAADRALETPAQMVAEARRVLRPKYYQADAGITGANFLIAETGSTVIVTNEGNGDLTQTLPRVHIVLATIEKVVPNLEDCATLLRVLGRSAGGQEMTAYTTFSTGPTREGDCDGPREYHVVLLDNQRSELLGAPTQDLLQCIRCGACMNHCPVYLSAGGHAYGWVYPGPLGKAFTPQIMGLEDSWHLPAASSFCGRCNEVCPVEIPLTDIMRHWREESFEQRLVPARQRLAMRAWGFLVNRPRLYRWATRFAGFALRALAGSRGIVRTLPLAGGWTRTRDMPRPSGSTFMTRLAERERRGGEP